jgi:uncharacterized protein YceH (UPF0502 family)
MIELTPDEARVMGVLIEKELTTPDQYPLTLNAVMNGANQKNNRDPVTNLDDNAVRSALIGLRNKGLVVQLDGHGQRTSKYRHEFMSKAGLTKAEMVLLAELFLRGPQTVGELRGRASRMAPMDSLEMVRNTLGQLMNKPEPLVKELPPAPGSRAERFVQLMCAGLHPEEVVGDRVAEATPPAGAGAGASLGQRVVQLEEEVSALRAALSKLAAEVGAGDPFAGASSGEQTSDAGETQPS